MEPFQLVLLVALQFVMTMFPRVMASRRGVINKAPITVLCWLAFASCIFWVSSFVVDAGDRSGVAAAVFLFLFGGVAAVLWIVALVWAFAAKAVAPVAADPHAAPAGRQRRPEGFPVVAVRDLSFKEAESIPAAVLGGRFRISGVDRETRMDTTWHVNADSEANARAKAELEGILVTGVQLEGA